MAVFQIFDSAGELDQELVGIKLDLVDQRQVCTSGAHVMDVDQHLDIPVPLATVVTLVSMRMSIS
jgi:hypothetical protein